VSRTVNRDQGRENDRLDIERLLAALEAEYRDADEGPLAMVTAVSPPSSGEEAIARP
jgi:hypothetical protein